jgi:hypothetical protein
VAARPGRRPACRRLCADVAAPAAQDGLAKACPGIISSRFIGNVFDDELGQPGTFFYVKWAQQA